MTVVCVFPGVYGNMNKYLRYYYIDLKSNKVDSKTISYDEMGWSDVRFDTYSTGFSTWMVIEDKESKHLKYILLDNKGKTSQSFNFYDDNSHRQSFILDDNMILNGSSSGIRLTER